MKRTMLAEKKVACLLFACLLTVSVFAQTLTGQL